MRQLLFAATLAGALATTALPAAAQAPTFSSTGAVVTTCGATAPFAAFVAGRAGPFTVDTTGRICFTGTVTASVDTTGLATSANQVLQITQETAVNTNLGAPGATACATDTGTCSLNALLQRLAQRLTTINTTLGSPFQAGGSIGNTSFGATQATAANLNAQVVGPAASGTALSGNPVRIGLSDGTNVQNLLAAIALGDGVNGNNTAATAGWVWNGATWDRMPGTTAGVTVRSPVAANFLVTANAGTNLNTSLLALESGGNLATLAGTVTSSRAAVNPIVGQAGVQGGAGASTALTQRVALATDANTVQLAANQSVNVAQINGVTPLMGNGTTGTGSPRVTIASDNTAFSVNAAITAASGAFASGSQPIGITPTDRTITSATGSSQTVMSANASRKSLTIVNTGNANCGINPTGGTAAIGGAGTLTLVPFGSYTPRVPSLSAITAICTAAQPLYADES